MTSNPSAGQTGLSPSPASAAAVTLGEHPASSPASSERRAKRGRQQAKPLDQVISVTTIGETELFEKLRQVHGYSSSDNRQC